MRAIQATIDMFEACISRKIGERPNRHENLIFQHDNGHPHVAVPPKNYLENAGWEILAHPPYSPDIAPSDYHLFRSMQHHLSGIQFTNVEGIKKWLDCAKDEHFFRDGVHKLLKRWEKSNLPMGNILNKTLFHSYTLINAAFNKKI